MITTNQELHMNDKREPFMPGRHKKLWSHLAQVAAEAVKVSELEISGTRDGDGYWHGSDVVGHTFGELRDAIAEIERYYADENFERWHRDNPNADVRF
jgi:hypothetical protein